MVAEQSLRIRELEAENASLPQTQMPPPLPPAAGWKDVVNAKLVLEDGDWKATISFKVEAGRTIRMTATARSRFVLHLATDVIDDAPTRKRSFNSVERPLEAMQVTRTFGVTKAGNYAIVLVPAGISRFHAEVKVEREYASILRSL